MAPRSIWNGALLLGEVAVPVELHPGTIDRAVHFHEVRLPDGCRLVHRRVGSRSGREVPPERLAKVYAEGRGRPVLLEDAEIAAARGSRAKVIEIEHFTPVEQIDPVYYDRPYLVGAQAGGERAYRVLVSAIERTELAGIGRVVLRTREQLVALRVSDRTLVLHTMRFADEVVERDDLRLAPLHREPSAKEVEMARRLIDSYAARWRAARHRDRHREAVLALIARKAAGEEIEPGKRPRAQAPRDLLAALEASLDAGRPPRGRSGSRSRRRRTPPARSGSH